MDQKEKKELLTPLHSGNPPFVPLFYNMGPGVENLKATPDQSEEPMRRRCSSVQAPISLQMQKEEEDYELLICIRCGKVKRDQDSFRKHLTKCQRISN